MPNADDAVLQRRISVAAAAKFLGCSGRHVRDLAQADALDAIDVAKPGSSRATWAVSVASLRQFIAERERASKVNNGDNGTTARERFQAQSIRAKLET